MSEQSLLAKNNIHFLQQGIDLLNNLDDAIYSKNDSSIYKSSIGKHMRHVLDHYLSFVQHKNNHIDYDARKRDKRIETDRKYAISVAYDIINKLEAYLENFSLLQGEIFVRSNEGAENQKTIWSESSIMREFQFLLSHTVHHYALMAIILRLEGYKTDTEFGVAPSTLRYQKQQVSKTAS